MAFNLDLLDQPREQWFPLSGVLTGTKVLVRYASPEYGEAFRRLLLEKRIYHMVSGFATMAPGRDKEYCLEFCRHYVTDWAGFIDTKGDLKPYTPEGLAKVMRQVRTVMEDLGAFISTEEAYFKTDGSVPM